MPLKKATRKSVRSKKATRKTVAVKKPTRKTARAKKPTRKTSRAKTRASSGRGGQGREADLALFGLTQEARAGVVSLQGLRRGAASSSTVDPDEKERRRVYDVLRVKLRSLNEQARYLATVHPSLDTDEDEDEWLATERANSQEQNLCRARLEELTAQTRFRDPGSAAERRLLDAIRDVGAAARRNAAFVEVVGAILKVVQTYKASDTK